MDRGKREKKSGWGYLFGSFSDALAVMFKQKMVILTAIGITLSLVSIWVLFFVTPLYEASSSLLIKFAEEHLSGTEAKTDSADMKFDKESALLSAVNMIASQDLAEQVVQTLGIDKAYPGLGNMSGESQEPLQSATKNFQRALTLHPVIGSGVIEIFFKHPQPEIAVSAVNLLIDFFKEKHLQISSDPNASALGAQLGGYEKELQEAKTQLQDFKQKLGFTSVIDQKRLLFQQRNDLDASLARARDHVQALNSELNMLEGQKERLSRSSITGPQAILEQAKADLLALQQQEQALTAKDSAITQPILNIRKEIALVEKFINQEQEKEGANADGATTEKPPIPSNLEQDVRRVQSELKEAESKSKGIGDQIEVLDEKIHQLGKVEKTLERYQQDVETVQQQYQMYLKKVEKPDMTKGGSPLNIASMSVVLPAAVPTQPVGNSSIWKLFLLAFFVGTGVGVVMAFVVEHLRGGYTTHDQAARDLELPILAWIPHRL